MIERDLELRLVGWYDSETSAAPGADLRDRIMAIPERRAPTSSRRTWWLLAAALLMLGLLLGGGLVIGADLLRSSPSIERLGVDPSSVDTADTAALLARAVERAGEKQGSKTWCHAGPDGPRSPTAWGAAVCVNSDWDGSWRDRHLLFRVEATPSVEVARLLVLDLLPGHGVSTEWETIAPGRWLTAPIDESKTTLPWSEPSIQFAAIAVASEPIFFIVTGPTIPEVRSLAEAVLAELREMPSRPDGWAGSEGSLP